MLACFLRYVPLEDISLPWWRHHWRWRDAEFRSLLLHTYVHWAGRDLYRATLAVTQSLGFCVLMLSYPKEDPSFVGRLLRRTGDTEDTTKSYWKTELNFNAYIQTSTRLKYQGFSGTPTLFVTMWIEHNILIGELLNYFIHLSAKF